VTARRFGVVERRARLGRRHLLTTQSKVDNPVEVANALLAIHGTDPASIFLEFWARMGEGDASVKAIESALYDERSIVRMLGMRRTMFVVPVELVSLIHAAASRDIAVRERKLLVRMLEDGGVTDDAATWLVPVEQATLRALAERSEALAGELSADVSELGIQLRLNQGKKYEGMVGVSTRVLFVLAIEGHIARGRPRGSWISSQHRWAPISAWLPGGIEELPSADAQVELARRWLSAYGPATLNDLKWWTGWTMGQTRRAVAVLDVAEVDLETADSGGPTTPGIVLADDIEPDADGSTKEPWVALLPALDATPMGWAERDWYLGAHRAPLFDRSGNIGPTVWVDGRIVGGWAVRKSDGSVAMRLLEDVGSEAAAAVDAEAERLTEWLAGVRFTPRFPTPLQRELGGS
jgi:Winged helix DNA-binding domain